MSAFFVSKIEIFFITLPVSGRVRALFCIENSKQQHHGQT